MLDDLVIGFDRALRTITGHATSSRPTPGANIVDGELTPEERRHAAGLMRVNHTGEICAQALYAAQAHAAGAAELPFPVRRLMRAAADVMRAVAYRI